MQEYKFIGGELDGQTLVLPNDTTEVRASLRYGEMINDGFRETDYYQRVSLERPIKIAAFVHVKVPFQEAFDRLIALDNEKPKPVKSE